MSEFKREPRYYVIKRKSLDFDQCMALDSCISKGDIRLVEDCVVVESDWPEYEPTWLAIQDRVEGRPIKAGQGGAWKCSGCGATSGSSCNASGCFENERDAPPATGVTYLECRECDICQHAGINDSADGKAACHSCDWSGDSPDEDVCPGCGSHNGMAAACPDCGGRYVFIASHDLPTTTGQQPSAGVIAPRELLEHLIERYDAYSMIRSTMPRIEELRAMLARQEADQ